MGNVTTSLRISSADVLSTSVDINVLANLNADSGTLSRAKVVKTAVDANALEVYTLNDKTESAYLYLRKLETEKENYVYAVFGLDSSAAGPFNQS